MNTEDVAMQVREARKARKWTQADLARAANVSLRSVSGLERGEVVPQSGTLRAIMRALGLEDAAGDAQAEATRDEWAPDVRVFLDVVGLFLMTMPEGERRQIIHDVTRRIVNR